jgi:HK97 family phage portal protein
MPNGLNFGRARAAAEQKMALPAQMMSVTQLGAPTWSRRSYESLVVEGYLKNPVVYRSVRLVAESAARIPFAVEAGGKRLKDHPVLSLLRHPNPRQSGVELLDAAYAYLQTAGNAFLEAVPLGDGVGALYPLRPDRMRALLGSDGYPEAYVYTVGGRSRRLGLGTNPIDQVRHITLFHPLDDHQGFAPLEAALTSLDLHNGATAWNKALLDNAARPSGALVYTAGGTLTETQFRRMKAELEEGFQGSRNAGRPMVLEGGLDWKSMALSPQEMDFVELKHVAAREIALAFGVPPMLLGIPGDNTYANLAEANRAFWRQTVVPLVRRMADELGGWLGPAFEGAGLVPDLDDIEALAEDRAALWARVTAANFLDPAEKRRLLGLSG